MHIEINNNKLFISISENFNTMLAYLYLYCFEFVSDGLFVPSLNPPSDNNFAPTKKFFEVEHKIMYKKSLSFFVDNDKIVLSFETIEDAKSFKDELERTW